MRLLLVEDNVALADSLCSVLKRAGYAVDWRTDGRDAVVLGEQEPYDLARGCSAGVQPAVACRY